MSNLLSIIHSPDDVKRLDQQQLDDLAQDLRQTIIHTVSKNGGHLASNLGMVETTLAIHKVFDLPDDKVIFDVGHQSYAHKLLTGRNHNFHTLRQADGISGFPKREESDCDAFNTGHSSTSISAAVGMARARDMQGLNHHVLAVIGDGALTGGMVWEALNDVGHARTKLTIIINDNEMSISKNVGAMSKYLSNLRSRRGYVNAKGVISRFLLSIPLIGRGLNDFIEKSKDTVKYFFLPNVLFEEMGFKYYGIVDGHDTQEMITILEQCKALDYPSIIHMRTIKGKGCQFAEDAPDQYHSTGPFNPESGDKINGNKYALPEAIANELSDMVKRDSRVCVVTAAMEQGCGLDQFKARHPKRFFDVGIAEQHAVTMAAGLAAGGMKPCFTVYSSFLQRAYDQIIHDVCLQNLPVVFIVYNSGIVGNDGETHHGVYDISFLRHIPNLNVLSPSSIEEAKTMLHQAYASDAPCALLMGSQLPQREIYNTDEHNVFKWHICTQAQNTRIAVLSTSTMLIKAMDAIRSHDLYLDVDVYNARSISPLDEQMLLYIAQSYDIIVTIEDNLIQGGFGSAIAEYLAKHDNCSPQLRIMGYDDTIIPHGTKDQLYDQFDLNTESIRHQLLAMLGKDPIA